MSNLSNMEFVEAVNPHYAFPIVGVILCAFIVYALGFKSPVQPPSFVGIEEEKKVTKKRKTKDSNKGKSVQNGKIVGNAGNKTPVSTTGKKKESEKSSINEKSLEKNTDKKANKKNKSQVEKKTIPEKTKKESISHEEIAEDGWVQLVSKKGRKSRKKDEATATENQIVLGKSSKNDDVDKSNDSPVKEIPVKVEEVALENIFPEKKLNLKTNEEPKKESDVVLTSEVENKIMLEISKPDACNQEKIPSKDEHKSGKLIEETSNKAKKKKKKNPEVMNAVDSIVSAPETPAVQVTSCISDSDAANNSAPLCEPVQVDIGKVEIEQPKETKSSNVVFDELAGLYPESNEKKDSKKKKKVRRDH